MRPEDVPEIRELALFATMASPAFDGLVRGAYLQTFPPAVELIREGDGADFLHVLVDGGVELFARANNRETTMSTLAPVSTFILAATITDLPYLMSARTIARSRIALIPSEDVRRAFAEDGAFAAALVAELADGFRQAIRQVKNLKLRTSVERLANYLIRQHAATAGRDGSFVLPCEKRMVASLLGMTPENLSRAFASLRAHGVGLAGSRVRITDIELLRSLGKPSPLIDSGP